MKYVCCVANELLILLIKKMHMDVQELSVEQAVEKIISYFSPMGITEKKHVQIIEPEAKGQYTKFKFNIEFMPFSVMEKCVEICNLYGLLPMASRSGTGIVITIGFTYEAIQI